MPWFKVSDTLGSDLATTRIPRARRNSALGLWVQAGAWSSAQLTDGFIPEHMLDELCGTPDDAAALVTAGYWDEAEGGWQFAEWASSQPTREEVLDKRARHAEAQARHRNRRRDGDRSVIDHANVSDHPPSRPDPSRPDPTSEPSVEASSVGEGEPPSPFCPRHPSGTDRPCQACKRHRVIYEQWEREQAAQPRAERPHVHLWTRDGTCARPLADGQPCLEEREETER